MYSEPVSLNPLFIGSVCLSLKNRCSYSQDAYYVAKRASRLLKEFKSGPILP